MKSYIVTATRNTGESFTVNESGELQSDRSANGFEFETEQEARSAYQDALTNGLSGFGGGGTITVCLGEINEEGNSVVIETEEVEIPD